MGKTGLQPLCTEYVTDLFVARNRDKYRLCRPFFEVPPNHYRGLPIIRDFGFDGRKLCEFLLVNGMALSAFHHSLLCSAFPGFERHLRDYSQWFSAARRDRDAYLHYLALFINDGILFENYLSDDSEERCFAVEKCSPASPKPLKLSASNR